MAKVEAAMGPAWRPPAPHKGGKIDLLENSHGFVVWIDRNGLIGIPTTTIASGTRSARSPWK